MQGSLPLTLALDASTYVGSVAVLRGGEVLAEREAAMRGELEERLLPAVDAALRGAAASAADIDRVACGGGPGSFTSLRIAASIAKGIAEARGVPLYAVSSLLLIVAGLGSPPAPGDYLALLDAMRGEWFAAWVHVTPAAIVEEGPVRLLDRVAVSEEAARLRARVIGPGCASDARPHARGVARLLGALDAQAPVDLVAWEPDYGRKAEAQVRWEAMHGRALPGTSGT